MTIVNLSYVRAADATEPRDWLKKIRFYTGIVERMSDSHAVHSIHCIGYSDVINQKGVTYHFFNPTVWQRLFPFALHKYVGSLNPDVVIVHGLHFPWRVLDLKKRLDDHVRIYIQHHAEKPYPDFRRILQKRADRFVRGYFFASRGLASEYLRTRIISSEKKVFEVMEASSGFAVKDKSVARRNLGVRHETTYLWVGRLDENKDPFTLLKAFIPFAKKNPGVCLNMIFKGGELIDEVKRLLSTGPENIRLIGKVAHDQMEDWYNASDFIISTSHYEGSGISLCEAMSCGCIPMVTKIPSFDMMTAGGTVGLNFEAGNANELTSRLEQSFDVDRDNQRSRTLQQFRTQLSFEAIAEKMLRILSSES